MRVQKPWWRMSASIMAAAIVGSERPSVFEDPARHGLGPFDRAAGPRAPAAGVGAEHDVVIEDGDQCIEVARA